MEDTDFKEKLQTLLENKPHFADESVLGQGLHFNGFNYCCKNPLLRTRYGCVDTRKCKAKLTINANHDKTSIKLENDHTCSTKHKDLEERLYHKKITEEAKNCVHGSAKAVIENVTGKCRPINGEIHYLKKLRTIQRHRSGEKSVESYYDSVQKFGNFLQENPGVLNRKQADGSFSTISAEIIQSSSSKGTFYHIAFFCDELINIIQEGDDLFIDATFSIIPKVQGAFQVLVVEGKHFDTVSPICWVVMSRRKAIDYTAVWGFLRKKKPDLIPTRVHCDYEPALLKSITSFWNDGSCKCVKLCGCFFHFVQAILRKAKSPEYRLYTTQNNAEKDPLGHKIIRYVVSLALLPECRMEEGFQEVLKLINNTYADDKKKLKRWKKFMFKYFKKTWMVKYGPGVFSVYWQVDRTNNFVESNNHMLNNNVRNKPTCHEFIVSVIKEKDASLARFERAKKNFQCTQSQKLPTRVRDHQIWTAWVQIAEVGSSVKTFLENVTAKEDKENFNRIHQAIELEEAKDSAFGEDSSDDDDTDSEYGDDDSISQAVDSLHVDDDTLIYPECLKLMQETMLKTKEKTPNPADMKECSVVLEKIDDISTIKNQKKNIKRAMFIDITNQNSSKRPRREQQ